MTNAQQRDRVRCAVAGAGVFGENHLRVLAGLSTTAELVGVLDADPARAQSMAEKYQCRVFANPAELIGEVDAVVVATPTIAHEEVAVPLLEAGIDVLIEKPIAPDLGSAGRLTRVADENERILQVGHLERFNPAVRAMEKLLTTPLFFEVHRMSLFSPRSLDVDVVLDLMIHDIEIVLALVKQEPEEIRAAGISILSDKVDIANVRLQFPGGCVANLTASRVSTEKVRKLRLFQPNQYVSVDYTKQEIVAIGVSPQRQISFQPAPVTKGEPLQLEVQHFLECVRTRQKPLVGAAEASAALAVAMGILDKIEAHTEVVRQTLSNVVPAERV
jgi:predicted dehydrogenase